MALKRLELEGAIPFSAGGSREEIAEVYRLFADAGMTAFGIPVEGLTSVEITVPGRTFQGLDGIKEYIKLHESQARSRELARAD